MHQSVGLSEDLSDARAGIEPAQRVEIVNQRLVEDRPRFHARRDVGRDTGVAGQRPQHLWPADHTVDDSGVHVGELGGESPVEPDLQRDAGGPGRVYGAVSIVEGEGHRLLAEHVLACVGRGDDEIGVRSGRRADRDCFDSRIGD